MTNFFEPRSLADPDVAARRLVEIANTIEPIQDGRIHIEKINAPFLPKVAFRRSTGLARAIELGWLWKHESGTHVKFTPAGAELLGVMSCSP